MISFRKAFVLLAVVVALTAVAGAQSFQCAVNAGAPTIARAEGVAEEVGQVLLTCTGGVPAVAGQTISNNVNIQVYLNTQVTSRLLGDTGGWSEALLLVDDPAAGTQVVCNAGLPAAVLNVSSGWNSTKGTCDVVGAAAGTSPYKVGKPAANAFQGKYTSAVPNSMSFNGIPLDAPGTSATRTLRIVNIRANASAITSSSFIPGNITMFIAITGTGAPGIGNNAQQVVAYTQKGFSFSLRKANGDAYSTMGMTQCTSSNSGAPDAAKGCINFRVRFTELFGTAFRPNAAGAQDTLGAIYNTEGMYILTDPSFSGSGDTSRGSLARLGVATQATRLAAKFTNIPAGVRIFVTDTKVNTTDIVATRSDGTDLKTGTAASDCASAPSAAYTELTSANIATWGVTNAEPSTATSIDFGVLVVYAATGVTPGTTPTQATGYYSPLNTQTTIGAARGSDETSSGHPLPRFIDPGISPIDAFTIVPCRTNLLFPFVTNQAGFDTGLAISNTSMAPSTFGGSMQAGPCTINYYGQTTGGGAAPAAQTSASIPAGGQLVFSVAGGGGVLGSAASINPTPGFQGYVIAQCNFQYAHGFAFVSDLGAARLAEGYLALVMDKPADKRTGENTSESLDN